VTSPARPPRAVPLPVALAQIILAGVAALHLSIVVITLTHQTDLRLDLTGAGLAALNAHQLTTSATTTALAVHIPLLLLTGTLAATLRTRHPWVLRPATVSQAFGIVFARLSTPPLHVLNPLVPTAIAASAAVLVLLWVPARSREFFASHPRSRRSRTTTTSEAAPQPDRQTTGMPGPQAGG